MEQVNNQDVLEPFDKALMRLEEALLRSAELDDLVIVATIQRFEFTFELGWEALKRKLLIQGIETTTPRHSLQQAYAVGWLDEELIWLNMLRDRNLTSHTYREEQALEIYRKINSYAIELRKLSVKLRNINE
jgi:nucleotidyltransferase substrate binding protein (TIGR01987 family)